MLSLSLYINQYQSITQQKGWHLGSNWSMWKIWKSTRTCASGSELVSIQTFSNYVSTFNEYAHHFSLKSASAAVLWRALHAPVSQHKYISLPLQPKQKTSLKKNPTWNKHHRSSCSYNNSNRNVRSMIYIEIFLFYLIICLSQVWVILNGSYRSGNHFKQRHRAPTEVQRGCSNML